MGFLLPLTSRRQTWVVAISRTFFIFILISFFSFYYPDHRFTGRSHFHKTFGYLGLSSGVCSFSQPLGSNAPWNPFWFVRSSRDSSSNIENLMPLHRGTVNIYSVHCMLGLIYTYVNIAVSGIFMSDVPVGFVCMYVNRSSYVTPCCDTFRRVHLALFAFFFFFFFLLKKAGVSGRKNKARRREGRIDLWYDTFIMIHSKDV